MSLFHSWFPWQHYPSISQNKKSSDPTGAFMKFTSVSYLALILTEVFTYSSLLWPPQSLYNLRLTFPSSFQPIIFLCDSPIYLHSTPCRYTFTNPSPSLPTFTLHNWNSCSTPSLTFSSLTWSRMDRKYWIYQALCPLVSISFIVVLYAHIKIQKDSNIIRKLNL